MPPDIQPFDFEIRVANTGKFYVAARDTTTKYLWGLWTFHANKADAEMAMYTLELARVGRTWPGPSVYSGWRGLWGPK
jgi:hypothetical protein